MEGGERLHLPTQSSQENQEDSEKPSTQQVSSLPPRLAWQESQTRSVSTVDSDASRCKRKRSGTPVDHDGEDQQQRFKVEGLIVSDAETSFTRPDPRTMALVTSEGDDNDDTARSVLFSEQVKAEVEIDFGEILVSHASTSTSVKGNLDDYIPQPEPALEVQAPTDVTGATAETDIAEFIKEEEYAEDIKDDENEEHEQGLGQDLDESQNQNDFYEDQDDDGQEDDDDLAKPAAWLSKPCKLERKSRGLEDKPKAKRLELFMRRLEGARQQALADPRASDSYAGEGFEEEEEEEDDVLDYTNRPPVGEEDESYHSGDSHLYDMEHRPVLERTAIKRDIRQVQVGVKCLRYEDTGEYVYRIVDRLGEGTFSSVYRAYDTFHHYFNNEDWTYQRDNLPRSYIEDQRSEVQVALKKILVTSSPARIENELAILESLRGCENVSTLITAFREEDQVIIVMPYHRTDDFRHFYRHMDTLSMRLYMMNLMRALRDIHRRGIIHRDVKPANFLYDYESSRGVLCDFGLAERYTPPAKPTCQHGPATLETLHGKRTKTSETATVEQAVYDARKRAKLGDGRVGFNHDDKRPQIKTNRAGTRGFRAPEVLLKCPDQTVAIDIWSAGVILLSILTQKFPVFNSSDDIEALLEIAAVFGRNQMERCAMLHNRTIITNVPTVDNPPDSLASIILRLNPHVYTPPDLDQGVSRKEAQDHIVAVDNAIDLCTRLLRLDATKRMTAAAALEHPFLALDEMEKVNYRPPEDFELLDPKAGRCGPLHGYQDGKHKAYFGTELVEMHFGQGRPPSRTELCPEHEHWQQRTVTNVLAVSNRFPDDDQHQIPTQSQRPRAPMSLPASKPQRTNPATAQLESQDEEDGVLAERDANTASRGKHTAGYERDKLGLRAKHVPGDASLVQQEEGEQAAKAR